MRGLPPGRKPRVLFVNTRSALGADVAVHLELIRNFDPAQVEVHIATNRNAVDLEKTLGILKQVPHLNLLVCNLGYEVTGKSRGKLSKMASLFRNLGAMVSLLRLAWYVRTRGIDILHATDRPRDALFSTLLARLTGTRNIIHVHIKWYPEIGRATTWALQECTGVLAISQFVRQSLIDGGVPPHKIYTALNATDTRDFDPERVPRGFLRQRYHLSEDTPLIGIVARIMLWKGHMELVEALAKVRQILPNVRLAIVGRTDALAASGDTYEHQVRRRIAELGLEAHVIWTGWLDAMPEVMADLDVLAVPSWEEPFGLVVTEAMAMQRPVVGFASGALPEILTDGVEGLLVPARDTEALADALIALLQDPERRREMGRRGRMRVLTQFTPRRQAEDVERIYRNVLNGEPDRTPVVTTC
ncbi:MAG: glycosyltransferase family 4 protein [Chloroherpetonaceae bacterium]|nr:glycosyltransferase family 4 protein [Chthonomonadaceae bacterium]MDW8206336.1 glycosyltransferase family 4 protein [Chloroherpetonaceae bacterium]